MLLFCQGEFLMVWVPIFWKKGDVSCCFQGKGDRYEIDVLEIG